MLSSPRLATWRNKPKFQQLFLHLPPSQKRSSKIYCTRKRLSREQKKHQNSFTWPPVCCVILSASISARFWRLAQPRKVSFPRKRGKKGLDDWWIAIRTKSHSISCEEAKQLFSYNSTWEAVEKEKKLDENFSYSYYTRVAHVQAHTHTHSCNTKSWREIRRLGLSIFNELLNVA